MSSISAVQGSDEMMRMQMMRERMQNNSMTDEQKVKAQNIVSQYDSDGGAKCLSIFTLILYIFPGRQLSACFSISSATS